VIFAEESRDGPVALATGDLEGRGHKDLVALTGDGRTLVFLGDGHGSFSREKHPPPVFNGNCRGAHVELANLDGGKPMRSSQRFPTSMTVTDTALPTAES
jgi:hypothetical protein